MSPDEAFAPDAFTGGSVRAFALEDAPGNWRSRAFRALRHAEFRRVWLTFMVGQLGFWVSFIALQALMARLTDSDGIWLGLLFFVNFIPMLVFTPIAGVVADRVDRKRILMTTYTFMTVIVGTLAVLTLMGRIGPGNMLPFAFLVGTVFAFNAPAGQSIVANAVPAVDLPSAISLQSVSANLARVVGPTIAAPVLAIWNEGAAFAIYAATSVVVIALLRRLTLSSYEPELDDGRFWRRLRGGLDHARERPPAMAALSVLAMSSLFAAAYLAMLPVIAHRVFDKGPTGFATLAAVTGIGSMFGALTTGLRQLAPTLRSTTMLVCGFGASVAVLGRVSSWPLALPVVAVVGVFYFSGMTSLNTLLQYVADDNKRGRMSSLFLVGWAGLVPIGGLWQGIAAGSIGVQDTITVAGAVTAVYSLAVLVFERRRQPVSALAQITVS